VIDDLSQATAFALNAARKRAKTFAGNRGRNASNQELELMNLGVAPGE